MNHTLVKNRPSSSQLLARILETPDLAAQIQVLPPPALARLIDRVGLEDAGEIVAFATTEQLALVFDEDLWKNDRPGEDERFDADRFLIWLEVMLEAGDAFVAQKLSELPPDLVTLAFQRHVVVVELESLMAELDRDEAIATEKALSNCLWDEIDQYQVIARAHEGWDNILASLLALDRDHHDLVIGILERCAAMSAEHIDDAGGLWEVLTSEEMLEGDVAADREDRRAEVGHVAPSAAAAFLKIARDPTSTSFREHDPMTRAWFRGLAKAKAAVPVPAPPPRESTLVEVLRDSGVVETAAPLLLPSGGADTSPLLVRAMKALADQGSDAFYARSEELAYLSNVLAAGHAVKGRRLRPIEAMQTAIATVSRGLELAIADARDPVAAATRALEDYPADGLFRLAWSKTRERA